MITSTVFDSVIKFKHWLLPTRCLWCGLNSDNTLALCKECQHHLAQPSFSCPYCALTINRPINTTCGSCVTSPNDFYKIIAPFTYANPISHFITRLKFHGHLALAELLGQLLAQAIEKQGIKEQAMPDMIVPIPLHKTRYRERGYNQALEIAKPIARHFDLPLVTNLIRRVRLTSPQSELDAKTRQINIKNAFKVEKKLQSRYVVLVDDVVTTGNTVNEVSRCLLESGVERIDVWAMARVSLGD